MDKQLKKLNALLKRYLDGADSSELFGDLEASTPKEYVSYSKQSGYYVAMTDNGPISSRMDTMEEAVAFIPGAKFAYNGDGSVFELI